MREYGMEIFHVEHFHDIHCGTMRYHIARRGVYRFTTACDLYYENEQKYHDIEALNKSRKKFLRFCANLLIELATIAHSKRIVGVSSPAKGNTLLNYCGIDSNILDYITEKSMRKIGRFSPGTHIPIVPDSRLIEDQPDYAIILAHNWENQIKRSLKDYKGEWIDVKRFKNIRSGAFGTSRKCDCSGTEEKGVHECCGLSCGTDKSVSDIHPVSEGTT